MPYTTKFERSPNSISSYSVNLRLTEWTKAVLTASRLEIKTLQQDFAI